MLHLFNYGSSGGGAVGDGWDAENASITINKHMLNGGRSVYGLLYNYGTQNAPSQYIRLRKTNAYGKKYIEFIMGHDYRGRNSTTTINTLKIQSPSISPGTISNTRQQIEIYTTYKALCHRFNPRIGQFWGGNSHCHWGCDELDQAVRRF